MTTDWTGNEDFFNEIRKGLEQNKEEVIFTHPGPRNALQAQIGTQFLRFLMELNKRGIQLTLSETDPPLNKVPDIVDAVVDIYSDKFVEILAGERPFNW